MLELISDDGAETSVIYISDVDEVKDDTVSEHTDSESVITLL